MRKIFWMSNIFENIKINSKREKEKKKRLIFFFMVVNLCNKIINVMGSIVEMFFFIYYRRLYSNK